MKKYNNKKITIDGFIFDSKLESQYYLVLKDKLNSGEITNLKLQPRYTLIDAFKCNGKSFRKTEYIADFSYTDKDGKDHIVDVKGMRTEVYKIKRKLLAQKYGIIVEEITKDDLKK